MIRLDMSRGGTNAETLRSYLNLRFGYYEEKYVITPDPTVQLADRFDAIITTAYKQTGLKVVILIDEYDSPLQHSWKTPEHEACTEVYREVFAILKADDEYERLVFITGITKFTQIPLFSVLNNLTNISFLPEYAAICGITEEEIKDNFKHELEKMAEVNGWTLQETHDKLKDNYDGTISVAETWLTSTILSALSMRLTPRISTVIGHLREPHPCCRSSSRMQSCAYLILRIA